MKCWQQSLLCEVTFEFDGKPMTRHFLHKMPRPVQKSSSHRSDQTNENPLQLADTRTPRMRDTANKKERKRKKVKRKVPE